MAGDETPLKTPLNSCESLLDGFPPQGYSSIKVNRATLCLVIIGVFHSLASLASFVPSEHPEIGKQLDLCAPYLCPVPLPLTGVN
ncbi:hypothetical protein RvY_17923 [Ramazzottius varieornatus]|uniref:Uncharacterized protein n=1 Tax=Ramazzottius varieornatus TaxID=947166 RepID=A0A1D1W9J1_RAMVA|nr:hypothetical protein RvY_17923 [Ramazzottius varieornatus]